MFEGFVKMQIQIIAICVVLALMAEISRFFQ